MVIEKSERGLAATYASRLTAELPSAIATIAVSGPRAWCALREFVMVATQSPQLDRIYYAVWHVVEQAAGEQVVLCRTAEDIFEIHCHGGNAICRRILGDLESAGCAIVDSQHWSTLQTQCGEFQSTDAIAIAAEEDLLGVTTDRTAAIMLDQRYGAIATAIRNVIAEIESGRVQQAQVQIDALLQRSRVGLHLANPWRVVLAGPPNTGKSSLINSIVGWKQSIVHEEAGTTRDFVESSCAIDGWPICLSDTAGLRATEDVIESAGVARAREQIVQADLVIAVVDATVGWQTAHDEAQQLAAENNIPMLVAWNKSDLPTGTFRSESDGISTSAIGQPGTEQLLRAISQVLVPIELSRQLAAGGVPVPFRRDQVDQLSHVQVLLKRASLSQGEMEEAAVVLRSVLGFS